MAAFNLNLSDTHEALMDRIMTLCDLKTKKEVVENAIMLLAWAASEASRGLTIAAVDESGKSFKEVQIAALEGAKLFTARNMKKERQVSNHKQAASRAV